MKSEPVLLLVILLFASLLWTTSPALAQKESGRTEKEFATQWERADPHFLKGKHHFIKKNYDKAEAELKACLEVLPEHANALFFLAQADYLKGDFSQALADIQKAEAAHAVIAEAFSSIEAQRRKALLDEKMNKEQEVAFREQIYFTVDCKSDLELAMISESIKGLHREISALNSLSKERPQPESRELPADYSYIHGNILFKLKRIKEASDQYLKAIEADAGHIGAYNNLINIYYLAKDYENGLKLVEQAGAKGVELNPKLKEAVLKAAQK